MNIRTTLSLTAAAVFALTLAGCKGKDTLTPNQAGEITIVEYCNEEGQPDKDFFRASATGESMSREAAKKNGPLQRRGDAGSLHQFHD